MKSPKVGPKLTSGTLQSVFANQDFLRAPSIPESGEGTKESNLILRELIETNRILVEVQKQLALDFANRIAERKKSLSSMRRDLLRLRKKEKEEGIEKINKDSSFLNKAFDKVTKPAKGLFDRLKEFFALLLTGILTSAAFKWLKDPVNRMKLAEFFDFIGKHWKWIVGIIVGGLLLQPILGLMGAVGGLASIIARFWPKKGPRGPGGGLPGGGCLSFLCETATSPVFALSAFLLGVGSPFWDLLKKGLPKLGLPGWVLNPKGKPVWEGAFASFVKWSKEKLNNLVSDLDARWANFMPKFMTWEESIQDLRDKWAATQLAFEKFTDWETHLSNLESSLASISADFEPIRDGLGDLTDLVTTKVSEGFQNVVQSLKTYVMEGGLKADFDRAVKALQGIGTWVVKIAWTIVAIGAATLINGLLGTNFDFGPSAAFADGGLVEKYAKGGRTKKKKPCCTSCGLGFSAGKMALGGRLEGPSHAAGGIPIEAEGGEYVIRKSNVNNFTLPILDDINYNAAQMWNSFESGVKTQLNNNLEQANINSKFNGVITSFYNQLQRISQEKNHIGGELATVGSLNGSSVSPTIESHHVDVIVQPEKNLKRSRRTISSIDTEGRTTTIDARKTVQAPKQVEVNSNAVTIGEDITPRTNDSYNAKRLSEAFLVYGIMG